MELIEVNEDIEKRLEVIGWTPLHTRLLAHRIGDGSCNHYGHFEYNNKHVKDFLNLADFLKIKYWGPVVSDKYGTYKVIISKKTFIDFASIFGISHEELIRNPVLLVDLISKLSKDHQIQAILAFIVDDGSCKRWMPTIFEDQNKNVFYKIKEIWDNLFPLTSRDYTQITKKGTKVYHLDINREGLIILVKNIEEVIRKYGNYAGLWWKQKDLKIRYSKTVSERAKLLNETRINGNKKAEIILNYLKEKEYVKFTEIQKIINLSRDRTYLVLSKLVNNGRLFVIKAGSRGRYSLKNEDISFENRKRMIIEFIKNNGKIYNRDCRNLLNLRLDRCYKILKDMVRLGLVKQIKEKGTTYYVLL